MKFPARILALLSAFGLALALPTMGLGGQTLSASTATGTTEANITRIAAGLLEQSQFAHHAIDNDLAGDFLARYLDDLDWSRSLFLQSDLKDFAPYRLTLAQATHGAGDTSAAHAIFGRFLQRLEQRVTYTTDLLRTAKFDFTGHGSTRNGLATCARPKRSGGSRFEQSTCRRSWLTSGLSRS
jgi:carboxyl-terminal processing protease